MLLRACPLGILSGNLVLRILQGNFSGLEDDKDDQSSCQQLRNSMNFLTFVCLFRLVWSDDDWLKKFSGKTLEENKEEEGPEPPKAEAPEVRVQGTLPS